jgi:AcrR family transcriptional regulator
MAALEHHHRTLDDVESRFDHPTERASAFFLQHFDNWLAAREGRGPHIAALMEIAALKGAHRDEVEASYIAMFKRIRQYLRDGIAAGEMRECETTSATRAIMGSVEWAFSWLHQIPQDKVSETARQAVDIIGHGLYAGPGEYQPVSVGYQEWEQPTMPGFNREEQNRMKQEAFYKTGTWFFNKQGFNGTSLDEIAEHLHVSKGAFYYHIKNKEDLLFNCYTRSLDITEQIYDQAAAAPGTGMEKIEVSCRRIFQAQNSEYGPLIRYNTITALPMDRRKKIIRRTDQVNERFGKFLDAGVADGSVRPVNNFVAQQMIAGAVNAAMDISLWRRVDNLDEAAKDYFDVFFNGLRPRN